MPDSHFPPVFATNRPSQGQNVADEVNRLLAGLRQQLREPPSIAIATAYLNPQGFVLLADELEQAPRVRLLIGAEPKQPEERRFVRRPSHTDLLASAIAAHEAGLAEERDLAGFTVQRDAAEKRLLAWLKSTGSDGGPKVEVRRYLKGFLHGKAYIPEADLAGVLAGSSNLTYAGLRLNRELNLGYETGHHKGLIREWFEELWDESEPYGEQLIALYEERFKLHDPWIIFLRMLVSLYGYEEDGDTEYQPVLRLAGFQRDGVARIRRILDDWGGVLLADEVGLGKTFLAGELIAEATMRDRQRALVLVPAALKDSTWLPFLKTWDLLSARIEVMSYDELRLADEEAMKQLDEYALVVIDEAHNLRNAATQRADVVRRLLGGQYPKQLVLMTATPVNNSLIDLYTLVTYFVRNDAAFASKGIPSLVKYVRDAQAQDPETLSPVHLFAMLDEVAVRRTRSFVKRHYAGSTIRGPDGKDVPIEFPTPRVERVDYELDEEGQELLDRMISALEPSADEEAKWRAGQRAGDGRLSFARYMPSRYAIADDVEKSQVVNAGFLRSGLLKRLESSPRALAKTLGVIIANHRDFLSALDAGKVLRGRALTAWGEADEETSIDEVLEALDEDGLESVGDASEFYLKDLRADVEADCALLLELQGLADRVAAGPEPKAGALVRLLEQVAAEARRPSTVPELTQSDRRKVVIFSTFSDTVEDLHLRVESALASAPAGSPLSDFGGRLAPAIRGRKVGIDQTQRARTLARFAPKTAGPLRDDGTPIASDDFDILITTDVLSEGVNLQQAGRIINFDLPWNPMRLVQRHGRIDRIGSPHREVRLSCFFPAAYLDELLGLEETIQRKIAYAAVSVGVGDVIPGQRMRRIEVVLADNREQIERLRQERPELFESGGDSAALSGEEYRRRLSQAMEDSLVRQSVERLPMGSGTGFRSPMASEPGWVFAAEVGPARMSRLAFVPATSAWDVRREADGSVDVDENLLRSLSDADPGDGAAPADLPDAAYDGVFAAWPAARRAIWQAWMRLTDPANLLPEVKGVLRRAADLVRDARSDLPQAERDRLAVALAQRWPLRIAREVGQILDASGQTPADRVVQLRDYAAAEGLQPPPPPVPLPHIDEDDIRLVAWMAVSPATVASED